jgi:hypothetical protein
MYLDAPIYIDGASSICTAYPKGRGVPVCPSARLPGRNELHVLRPAGPTPAFLTPLKTDISQFKTDISQFKTDISQAF